MATQATGVTRVRDAGELRVKESDRIATIVSNLTRLGADITEESDGFSVTGPCRLRGAAVSACGDHRLAMALAVAGLVAAGDTHLSQAEVVRYSYPGFFEDLQAVQR
jgi:3-phosphoshikimate 1-carboxyvinyltransferase